MAPVGRTLSHGGAAPGAAPATHGKLVPAEILGDGTMAGVIGASAIALFFLLLDAARREALYTPSVLATAILRGVPPSQHAGVDLGMVAAYSALHGAAFLAVGVAGAWATSLRRQSVATPTLAITIFAVLELGFLFTCAVVDPALLSAVGIPAATVGNVLAAAGMAIYLHRWPHDAMEERETQAGHGGD
jgi:hypothetical protein